MLDSLWSSCICHTVSDGSTEARAGCMRRLHGYGFRDECGHRNSMESVQDALGVWRDARQPLKTFKKGLTAVALPNPHAPLAESCLSVEFRPP